MKLFTLFIYHLKHQIRIFIKNVFVRRLLIIFVVLLLAGGVIMGIIFGLNPPSQWEGGFRSREFLEKFSGLLFVLNFLIVALPTYVIIKGALKLLENAETAQLTILSPISSTEKFILTFGPLLALSSIPYLLFTLPFISMFIILDPVISILTFTYFIVLSSWSITFSLVSLIFVIDVFGKDRGLKVANTFPFLLFLLPVLFFYIVEDFRVIAPTIGYGQIVVFGLSLVVLPFAIISANKAFYELVVDHGSPQEWVTPTFGKYNPWVLVDRAAITWGIIPLIFFIGMLTLDIVHMELIHEGVLALLLLSLITGPLNVIFLQEKNKPDRWLLAPFSSEVKKIIWLKVGLPLFAVALVSIVYVGIPNNMLWVISVLSILISGMVLTSINRLNKYPIIEKLFFFLLLVACMATQYLFVSP